MKNGRSALATLCLVLTLACSGSQAAPAAHRILFIGNSLTYTNDLPRIVRALANKDGVPVEVATVAAPNYSLEEHWNERDTLRKIRSGRWTMVIMQQGPSSLDSSRSHLIEWSGRFAEEIRKAEVEPALMTVWPSSNRLSDFPRVIESYALAAEACSCRLIPAGEAWYEMIRTSGDLSLYGEDGFHPSRRGSEIAAQVVWASIREAD